MKIKSDTYYIMCLMCILFVMNYIKYSEAGLNLRLVLILCLGIIFFIFGFIKSTK